MPSTNRRPSYRKPTYAEAVRFAAINGDWLRMRRRQRTRKIAQWVAAILLGASVGAAGAGLIWLFVVGVIALFDGITNL